MIMTRPCRRMTRHLLQIFLTLGLTFTVTFSNWFRPLITRVTNAPRLGRGSRTGRSDRLLVAVDDPPAGQVVRREFDDNPVLGQDADVMLPHLAADVRQNLVAIGELDPEHGIREWLDYAPFDFDGAVFLRHILR